MLVGDSSGGNLAAAVSHYLAEVSEMHCRQNYLKAQVCIKKETYIWSKNKVVEKIKPDHQKKNEIQANHYSQGCNDSTVPKASNLYMSEMEVNLQLNLRE